ncbi:hypothetical protein G6R29_00875 [Fructobacillus sp. M2-14]|uniref:CopG family transcriptional regulator n=1 Tax=Fructobacillus broussonetiae TaxID=2713173 RepID=A0ABS5R1Z4_9LACO|nr:hypothetical protein [Fructobacillus broussonetiae]MBS9338187.1 hypothetical protein [Fructobacillus broussonetiae]
MVVTSVRLNDETIQWAKKLADFKGISMTGLLANLIEEAKQDDQDYQDAMAVVHAPQRCSVNRIVFLI